MKNFAVILLLAVFYITGLPVMADSTPFRYRDCPRQFKHAGTRIVTRTNPYSRGGYAVKTTPNYRISNAPTYRVNSAPNYSYGWK